MPDAFSSPTGHGAGGLNAGGHGAGGFSEANFVLFQQRMQAKTGIRLSEYKADQMCRRIGTLAQRSGCASFEAYASLVECDAARMDEFRDRMTINVTEVLRNPDRFAELTEAVLPDLLARRPAAPLSVWSAGCSYGAEAYTLAMLLHEVSPAPAHRILGTDVDPVILARAAHPCFSDADVLNLSPARLAAHFGHSADGYRPKPHLQGRVRFGPHDLLTSPYPNAEHDLIVCRNVLIYFTDDAKDRIARGFLRALRPGGVLFVGGTERLSDHRALGFELLRPFFYRKPPA